MTETTILGMLAVVFIVLFGAILIGLLTKLGRIRIPQAGDKGEREVAALLSALPQNEYIVLNDLILPKPGGTAQLDHVVVSAYGIFVIETKDIGGIVIGGENSDRWTKNLNGHVHTFYNPLKQNRGHILTVAKNLRIPEGNIFSYVTFSRRADLQVQHSGNVVYYDELVNAVYQRRMPIYTYDRVRKMADRLAKLSAQNEYLRASHAKRVQQRSAEYDNCLRKGICPKCRCKLLSNYSMEGQVLSCTNFRCNFTKQLQG